MRIAMGNLECNDADLRILVAALTEYAESSLPTVARLIPPAQEQSDAIRARTLQLRYRVQKALRTLAKSDEASTVEAPPS